MITSLLSASFPSELSSKSHPSDGEDPDDRRQAIKGKILQVGRMSRVFGLLREEAESGSELKSIEGAPHPGETLIDGAEEVKGAIRGFGQAYVNSIIPYQPEEVYTLC